MRAPAESSNQTIGMRWRSATSRNRSVLCSPTSSHRAGHHREVVGAHRDAAPVDETHAGDHAVGGEVALVGREDRIHGVGELSELDERAVVEKQVDAFAHGKLPHRALTVEQRGTAHPECLLASLGEILDEWLPVVEVRLIAHRRTVLPTWGRAHARPEHTFDGFPTIARCGGSGRRRSRWSRADCCQARCGPRARARRSAGHCRHRPRLRRPRPSRPRPHPLPRPHPRPHPLPRPLPLRSRHFLRTRAQVGASSTATARSACGSSARTVSRSIRGWCRGAGGCRGPVCTRCSRGRRCRARTVAR